MIVSISALALLIAGISDSPEIDDEQFLEEIQKRAFDYFWHEANPETGMVRDRASNFDADKYKVASIAATGFGLAALAIGKEHGWISREQAYHRAHTTLRFILDKMESHHGFYYHFVDMNTGERMWNCEVSSIDTALLVAGALFIGEYFRDTEVELLAGQLYQRVDFQWLLTDGGSCPEEKLIGHGWKPETGFLKSRWDSYNELMILYLLAMGSPTHPIHEASWEAWKRPEDSYAGYKTFVCGPLFVHQFSHVFVDFRNKWDSLGYDYWTSSVNATKANRQFCIDNADDYKTYSENVWGLTACDGPFGYSAYGAPPIRRENFHDGTVAPYAPAASIVFTPMLSLNALKHIYRIHSERLWGRYGFSDAFNLDQDWFAKDVIGIDQGATLMMIENYRSGLIWEHFMGLKSTKVAMSKAGFNNAK